MKIRFLIASALLLLSICFYAAAQFSQPPPSRVAPTCSYKKNFPLGEDVSRMCKSLTVDGSSVLLACTYYGNSVDCTTNTWLLVNGQWVEIDRSTAIHDWAFIVDGREYYLNPMYQDSISVDCGISRRGYVRVAIAGGADAFSFTCPNQNNQNQW